MRLNDLSTHAQPFVSVGDLSDYWGVSREYILKQISCGTLPAIRLGVRLFRIPTNGARDFEVRARYHQPSQAIEKAG